MAEITDEDRRKVVIAMGGRLTANDDAIINRVAQLLVNERDAATAPPALDAISDAVMKCFRRTEEGDPYIDELQLRHRLKRILSGEVPPSDLKANARYDLEIATEISKAVSTPPSTDHERRAGEIAMAVTKKIVDSICDHDPLGDLAVDCFYTAETQDFSITLNEIVLSELATTPAPVGSDAAEICAEMASRYEKAHATYASQWGHPIPLSTDGHIAVVLRETERRVRAAVPVAPTAKVGSIETS